jgi:hypothetical protein
MRNKPSFSARTAAKVGLVPVTIMTSASDFELLEAAASLRGVSTKSLVATLIHTIAAERLTNAVLDDDRG